MKNRDQDKAAAVVLIDLKLPQTIWVYEFKQLHVVHLAYNITKFEQAIGIRIVDPWEICFYQVF